MAVSSIACTFEIFKYVKKFVYGRFSISENQQLVGNKNFGMWPRLYDQGGNFQIHT